MCLGSSSSPEVQRCVNVAEHMQEKRQTAFANYRDFIGMDITSIVQLPLFIMEPYTMLQKVAEIMEYTELLDRAATTADPYERSAVLFGSVLLAAASG